MSQLVLTLVLATFRPSPHGTHPTEVPSLTLLSAWGSDLSLVVANSGSHLSQEGVWWQPHL